MVERQDIDALLISALYGELTPAEESRLAAHLESHPADRTALDDLTRAREALHESRILAFHYEPPQAISALLIQEASRRAPKKAPPEGEGWFARFVRSFVQHPAMAAAAMIVVVVGAASLVSRNSDSQFADTPPVETTAKQPAAVAAETPTAAPETAVAAPSVPTEGLDNADQFKVALADEQAKADKGQAELKASPETDPNVAFYADGASDRAKGGDSAATKAPTKPTPNQGLELRRRDAMPKDFEAAAAPERKLEQQKLVAKEAAQQEGQYRYADPAPPADDAGKREAGYIGDGRTGTGTSSSRASGGAAAPGAVAPTTPAPTTTSTAQNAGPRTTTAPRTQPPPPPKTNRQEIATDSSTGDGKAKAANDPNIAWARDQHAALVTAVRANNCGRAANIALAIANRAPSYYAQNVETDRAVKVCIAYINREREKDAEVRASRAKRSQLKNAEPSAPKRAADEPARPTSSDSAK